MFVKSCYKKTTLLFLLFVLLLLIFFYAKQYFYPVDFGKTFGPKSDKAKQQLQLLNSEFDVCVSLSGKPAKFLKAIVFPEVMRFNEVTNGIETESLHVLYVRFGEEYANFSIGIFQMKPTFAAIVESKAKQLLPDSIYKELQLNYKNKIESEKKRKERVNRLKDTEWQMVYLVAFVKICDALYANKKFADDNEKLNWYATVYNTGFDKTDEYILKKIAASNFYLQNGMPGKKYNYAAIAKWFYTN